MKITNPITLDVARSNSYICLLGKQFDSNSRYLQVTLTNNGQPLPIPSGAGVVLRATKADGAGSMTAGTVNGDGTALVEIDEAVLEVAGAASLSIEVTSGGQVLTSASCNLTVQKADASGWVKVYVAAASVSAGTYHISLAGQSYSFTTTQTIPAGGAIYFNSDGGTAQTRDASGNVLDASLTLTAGTSGTELTSDVPTMTFLAALAQQVGELADTDNLVAGSAEALLGGGTAENVAVALRGNAGNAREKIGKLIGGTIAWNQLCPQYPTTEKSGITLTNDGYGMLTASGTSSAGNNHYFLSNVAIARAGHKFLVALGTLSASSAATLYFRNTTTSESYVQLNIYSTHREFTICNCLNDGAISYYLNYSSSDKTISGTIAPMATDLTTALGPTIADYVYTLESGTAGAGVAWLARYFPKILGGYYAYAAPALLSVNVEGKKISGFNLWDEETELGRLDTSSGANASASNQLRTQGYLKVIPATAYYLKCPSYVWVLFYDGAKNVISSGLPAGNYAFSNNARGIGGTDKDPTFTTPPNCSFIRFYMQAGYGTTYNHDICLNLSNPLLNGKYFPHREFYYPIQSGELRGVPKLDANNNLTFDGDEITPDGTITRNIGSRNYSAGDEADPDVITDRTTTYYKLATPYTEAGQPFLAVERLDNGIEEVVDAGVEAGTRDVVVPVGQDATIYRDLAALLGAIPNPPTSAGTYTLRATVTTTNATFSWS